MEIPRQIQPEQLSDYLEVLSKSVFQTGISWRVVEQKWAGTREAFRGFDPTATSNLTPAELDELARDTRIIRNRRKVEAIVANARRMLELDQQHGGFRNCLRSHTSFEELVKDLRRQFKFIGDTGAYHFLWVVGEKVPPWEEWAPMAANPKMRARHN